MTDNTPEESGGGGLRPTRRQVIVAAAMGGTGGKALADLAADDDKGNIWSGTMALNKAYNVAGSLYVGPDSAKSNVAAKDGRVYMASDTQVEYHGDGGSWVARGIGSSSNPVPSVHTDQSSHNTRKTVTPQSHPNTSDLVSELNKNNAVRVASGTYTFDGPHTITASHVDIVFDDDATLEFDGYSDSGGGELFLIKGSEGTSTSLASDITAGDKTISVGSTSDFSAGQLVIIDDTSNFKSTSIDSGEICMVDDVVDGSTLRLRDPPVLDHTTANVTGVIPINKVTGQWVGGEWDISNCTSSGVGMLVRYSTDFEARNIDFVADDSTSWNQYFEIQESIGTGVVGGSSAKANGSDAQAWCQLEQLAKHCYLRDSVVYYGRAYETHLSGRGPSIRNVIDNVTVLSNRQFKLEASAFQCEVRNCTVTNAEDNQAFRDSGFESRWVNCKAFDSPTAFLLRGDSPTLVNVAAEGCGRAIYDESSGVTKVVSPVIRGCTTNALQRAGSDAEDVMMSDVSIIDSAELRLGSEFDSVTIDGGYIENTILVGQGCKQVNIDVEANGAGNSGEFFEDRTTTTNDEIRISGKVYDYGGSVARVDDVDNLFVDAIVPSGESQMGQYVVRADDGGTVTQVHVKNTDKHNNVGIGSYDLASVTRVITEGNAKESANAETPQKSWPPGTFVDFTDSGDGSGDGLYRIESDGTVTQVA